MFYLQFEPSNITGRARQHNFKAFVLVTMVGELFDSDFVQEKPRLAAGGAMPGGEFVGALNMEFQETDARSREVEAECLDQRFVTLIGVAGDRSGVGVAHTIGRNGA